MNRLTKSVTYLIWGLFVTCGALFCRTAAAQDLNAPFSDDPAGRVSVYRYVTETTSAGGRKVPFEAKYRAYSQWGNGQGWEDGQTYVSIFYPIHLNPWTDLIFIDARGFLSYQSIGEQAGGNIGIGYRRNIADWNTILGASVWFDVDGAHNTDNETWIQYGASLEAIVNGFEMRVNGYLAEADGSRNVINTPIGSPFYRRNFIVIDRLRVTDHQFDGFDAEMGGLVPFLESTGLHFYAGGYFLHNDDFGEAGGYKFRWQANLHEDVQIGMEYRKDRIFGSSTWGNVMFQLPNKPWRLWWRDFLKPKTTVDYLARQVERNYRIPVKRKVDLQEEPLIDPRDNQPIFVLHVDPDRPVGGNGTFENPFNALNFTNNPNADIIRVLPGNFTNPGTIQLFNNQRLLAANHQHFFISTIGTFVLPLQVSGANPVITNTAGGDVIQLASNNEVSGFDINGSGTGNGIVGTNIADFNLNRLNITNSVNGISITNFTGTGQPLPFGQPNTITNVNVTNSGVDGVVLNNAAGAGGTVTITTLSSTNNGDDGLQITSSTGAVVANLTGVTLDNNSGNGGEFSTSGAGSLTLTGGIDTASNNGADGLNFSNTGTGTLTATLSAGTFDNNGSDGASLLVNGGGTLTATFSTSTFSSNAAHGVNSSNTGSTLDLTLNSVTANSNAGGSGINNSTTGAGAVTNLTTTSVIAGSNSADGLTLNASGTATINATDTGSSFTGNGANGAGLTAAAGSTINGNFTNTIFNNNTADGLFATTSGGTLDIDLTNVTANNNTGSGLDVRSTGAGTVTVDGGITSAGNNGADGFTFLSDGAGSTFTANITNGSFSNNGGSGGSLTVTNTASMTASFTGSVFNDNGGDGLFGTTTDGTLTTTLTNVTADRNTGSGFDFSATGGGTLTLTGGITSSAFNGADGLTVLSSGGSTVTSTITGGNFSNNSGSGGRFTAQTGSTLTASLTNATFNTNVQDGLFGTANGAGATLTMTLSGITADNNGGSALDGSALAGGTTTITGGLDSGSNNGADGLTLLSDGAGSALTATLSNGTFNNNFLNGANITADNSGTLTTTISSSSFNSNGGDGARITADNSGTLTATISSSSFNSNGDDGASITADNGGTLTANISGNSTFNNNTNDGANVTANNGGTLTASFTDSFFNGNINGTGLQLLSTGAGSTLTLSATTITASANPVGGFDSRVDGTSTMDVTITGTALANSIFSSNTDFGIRAIAAGSGNYQQFVVQFSTISDTVDNAATTNAEDGAGDGILLVRQDSASFGAVGGTGPNSGLGDVVIGNNTVLAQTGRGNTISNNANNGIFLIASGDNSVTNTLLYDGNTLSGNQNGFVANLSGSAIYIVQNDANTYQNNRDHGVFVTTNDSSSFGTAGTASSFLGDTFTGQDANSDSTGDAFRFIANGTSFQNVLIGATSGGTRTTINGGQNGIVIVNDSGGASTNTWIVRGTDIGTTTGVAVDGINYTGTTQIGSILRFGGTAANENITIASSGDDGIDILFSAGTNTLDITGDTSVAATSITGNGTTTGRTSTDGNGDTIVDDNTRGDGISILETGGTSTVTITGVNVANNAGRGLDIDSRSESGISTYQIGRFDPANATANARDFNSFTGNGLQGVALFTTAQTDGGANLASIINVPEPGPGSNTLTVANTYQDSTTPIRVATNVIFENADLQNNGAAGTSADGSVFSVGTNTQMNLFINTINPSLAGSDGNQGDTIALLTHRSLEMNNPGVDTAVGTNDQVGLDAIGVMNVVLGVVDTDADNIPDARSSGGDRGTRGDRIRVATVGSTTSVVGSVQNGIYTTALNFRPANRTVFSQFNVFTGAPAPALGATAGVPTSLIDPSGGTGNVYTVTNDVDNVFDNADNLINTNGLAGASFDTINFDAGATGFSFSID